MRFPVKLKNRGRVLARIYRRENGYRLYWRVRSPEGKAKSKQRDFTRYADAKREGDTLVADLAKGSQVTALTQGQASDAMAALKHLQTFYVETGKRMSLLESAAGYCGAIKRLRDRPLSDVIDNYLSNVTEVKRVHLLAAVDEWIASRQPLTVAKEGKRPELSPGYHYNVSMWAREFANTFPGHAVCDLGKEHIDRYMANHTNVGPKSRNERRNVLRLFFGWCKAKDYLAATHRLLEANGMNRQPDPPKEIEPYTASELQAMLNRASTQPKAVKDGEEPERDYQHLLPIIALVGLGGIRLQESARFIWQDVWRVDGYVEVPAGKSKTRSRRLATMCASLQQWLEPYRNRTGALWTYTLDHFHRAFGDMLNELGITARKNGLRHGYVSAHYAFHSNEGLTAQDAGTSAAMIHEHYKGLMTKKQGEAWFAVAPEQAGNVIQLSASTKK